ncbi:type II secretion system protein GspL [Sphingomonas sp. CJ20]
MTTTPSAIGAPDAGEPHAAGVWTLAGGRLSIAEPGGVATILVPTEQVRLLAIDLPLPNRAKRLEALPFAVEDLVAEPLESLHLALGGEVAPKRYLVGVVADAVMAEWVALAEAAGLGHAAIVPDALALPIPGAGAWAVDLAGDRALVRTGDGAGFAVPAALLVPAWEAAGRPAVQAYGAPLPVEMGAAAAVSPGALSARLAAPALDLRQGVYVRRRASLPNIARRLVWIVAIGVAAHALIAGADTLMLRRIADSREDDTRALAAMAAPGASLGEDLAASVTDMLPQGRAGPPERFVPLLSRISGALAPLAGSVAVRSIAYQADTLTMDLDPGTDPGLSARIDAALRGARVGGSVTRGTDGSIRITARTA